jgi:hypothetical protein
MSLPYPLIGNFTGSINSGSFLNEQDTALFYVSQSGDIWFGFSPNDIIEVSAYNTEDDSLINWKPIGQDKKYRNVTLSYLDSLNNVKSFSFKELINDYIQYKNNRILVNPIDHLNTLGITEGDYKLSYIFTRDMAGSPAKPLSVKEISPSRTEVKLVPQGSLDIQYTAFCLKKFPIRDVSPVLLGIIQNCPYDNIYRVMQGSYTEDIEFLKTIFFLPDDGSVLLFLKNLYEDFIKYTVLSEEQIDDGFEPTRISRAQGIRSYFSNYLLQNYESISDFDSLEAKFIEFTVLRISERFGQYNTQQGENYKGARQFVYDFFVKYFYQAAIHPLQKGHQDKYFGLLKNVLNLGNNQYFHVLDHSYIDERQSPTDPLTLVLKLSADLPLDVSPKTTCWISNFSMVPYVLTVRLQNPVKYKTIRISAPNFGATTQFISKENVNKLYSTEDLAMDVDTDNQIKIKKSLAELNTDYGDFSNFVVFSSIATRLNIFKNKMVSWTELSSSLVTLNARYSSSISSSVVYPYYLSEKDVIDDQMTDIIDSFDGYESHLFNSGYYSYNLSSGSFVSSSFIASQDYSASSYDRSNRDSLIANTPEYILNDTNNEDYLTFLAMAGHHFDNIYTFIGALPIERQIKNELSSSIPTNTLKEMLYSFGWNIDDIIGNLDINEVYLNSLNSSSYNTLSAEERLQTIWNRILVTLPGIYKTKGTEECVNYLMACYGLPTSLISVREYGGTDYSNDPLPTYKLDEKTYMIGFSGVGDYLQGPIPNSVQTVEFKFSVGSASYVDYQTNKLFTVVPYPYSSSVTNSSWNVNIQKIPGRYMGRVSLAFGSGSAGTVITSSDLPIYNGDIFSVMVRKNDIDSDFQYASSSNSYPTQYDLYVQRNENGRRLFYSTSSQILNVSDNSAFSQYGKWTLSDGTFVGSIDKLNIWDVALDDMDFEEHVNDINSYGYSGSVAYQNLWVRIGEDYPKNLYYNLSGSSAVWVDNQSPYFAIPNYYSDTSNLSSSINATLYSASLNIINNRWLTYYPTGSVEIRAYGFPRVLHPNWSASYSNTTCAWVSSSVYPYHYRELTYQQDIDASKFGPTKYKNKKIRKIDYSVEARFDSKDRSTIEQDITVSGESNQLGFFIDPQDSKNKDIIRYIGKNGILELISDPEDQYADRYQDLRAKNYEYHAAGNKRTYFNEMLTVYKFYFDKSIFQAIKNVLPARANAYTGVVVEPTVLERPKYKNRPITSSVQLSYQDPGTVTDLYSLSQDILWANFNTDWYSFTSESQAVMTASLPPSYQDTIDLTRINEPIKLYPANFCFGYVTDELDFFQRTTYGDYEKLMRGWESEANCENWIYGSVSRNKPWDLATVDYHHVPVGQDETGTNVAIKHQILYYLMKVWSKYDYNAKTGEYVRSNNPKENTYQSASTYFYKYIVVDERFMNEKVHFYNNITTSIVPADPAYNVTTITGNNYYTHKANTFKNTPDQTFSHVSSSFTTGNPFINPISFDIVLMPVVEFFELSIGYPRNHYNHKSTQFSKSRYPKFITESENSIFVKGKQTIDTTINENGIDDGTLPVQSFNVSNVNVKNANNVLQYVASNVGTVLPNSTNGLSNTNGGTGISPITSSF